MNNIPVIIEAIGYLLQKLKKADKIYLIKLLYLADKYHAMQYGRTVTGDSFFAFENGPAGSNTMDILEYDPLVLGKYAGKAGLCFEIIGGHEYEAGPKCGPPFDMLSESDIEALDFVLGKFGSMKTWDVVEYTHTLKEWRRFEALFKKRKTKREQIKIEDVLSPTDDENFDISEEHLAYSLDIITGALD